MKMKIPRLLGFAACLSMATLVVADQQRCVSVGSAGVRTTNPGPSFHNVGQMAIGISSNATVTAYHGCLSCLRMQTTCRPGDVNGDGNINGLDVQPFTDIKVGAGGTPRELCASNMTIAQFIALLLAP